VEEEDPDVGENIFAQQKSRGMMNENYLLLDNQSTVNQIMNPNMLKNIRKSSKPIKIHCNAGMSKTELEGEQGEMTVYPTILMALQMCCCSSRWQRNTGSLTTAGIGTECSRCIPKMGW